MRKPAMVLGAAVLAASCATLSQFSAFVQPPRFEEARDQPAELTFVPPSGQNVLGGANVRLWTRVTNPNPFGFTLASLEGTLYLDEARAAVADFPLGVPLAAGAETVIPIDLSISFAELPGLANVARQLADREPVDYRLEGTVAVEAGRLGTPVFGPMTLVSGEID